MKKIFLTTLLSGLMGVTLMASNGEQLAQSCKSCHGANFAKAPLGERGHVIKGDSYKQLIKMITYYQHPEESDEMVMKAQVQNFTKADIKAVSKYISENY